MSKVIRSTDQMAPMSKKCECCQLLLRGEPVIMSSPLCESPNTLLAEENGSGDAVKECDSTEAKSEEEIVEDPEQYEERFRVDRRKLEQMLHG